MKKIGTPLLALAIITVVGLNSLSLGTSITYSVQTGDEFYYEFKFAKYSLIEQVPESEKNDLTIGMVKIAVRDIDVTSPDGRSAFGSIKERIWYREVDSGYELISSEQVYTVSIQSEAPHYISTFGYTVFKDGEVEKSVIVNFLKEAPIFIPNDAANLSSTSVGKTYLDNVFGLFLGKLADAYDFVKVDDENYAINGSTLIINQLQTSGQYSSYKIILAYDTAGVLSQYHVLSIEDPNHIIFTFDRVLQNVDVTGELPNEVSGYPIGILGIVSICSFIIIKKRFQKM